MTQPTPEYCRDLLRCIPQRPDREIWLYCISAIGNTYPENVALSLLLEHFTDELPNQHAYTLRHRLNSIKFGTLVWYARKYGYMGKYDGIEQAPPTPRPTPEPDPVSFADVKTDTLLHNADGERLYRLAVNLSPTVVNKTTDYTALTDNFLNVQLTISEIADVVKLGHAICPAQMVENPDGTITRNSSNFKQSEVIILDMDFCKKVNGEKVLDTANYIPLDTFLDSPQAEPVALAYTSCSHTPEHNRYRLIITLPYVETNPERYQKILKTFIDEYKADIACKDICRPFFGNTTATIYNLTTGEILQ